MVAYQFWLPGNIDFMFVLFEKRMNMNRVTSRTSAKMEVCVVMSLLVQVAVAAVRDLPMKSFNPFTIRSEVYTEIETESKIGCIVKCLNAREGCLSLELRRSGFKYACTLFYIDDMNSTIVTVQTDPTVETYIMGVWEEVIHPGVCTKGHNTLAIEGISSSEECLDLCYQRTDFFCRSLDWSVNGRCNLQSGWLFTIPLKDISDPCYVAGYWELIERVFLPFA
ncbi:hypothetical protein CAPTEDRAFT_189982 [Capitella teleta]|uniref:Apple domain-containing protein n=1 Tax=Capitella teleta TaxID=283909 RepID=R7U544_CAPTE|nr:hypothetical protein CAPTEDRAFT_189982 [Capitella teleta]|eukprot:ELT98275.1 hypothetical protein CAPTEDRAFT_189982 [Capitella teleta]